MCFVLINSILFNLLCVWLCVVLSIVPTLLHLPTTLQPLGSRSQPVTCPETILTVTKGERKRKRQRKRGGGKEGGRLCPEHRIN